MQCSVCSMYMYISQHIMSTRRTLILVVTIRPSTVSFQVAHGTALAMIPCIIDEMLSRDGKVARMQVFGRCTAKTVAPAELGGCLRDACRPPSLLHLCDNLFLRPYRFRTIALFDPPQYPWLQSRPRPAEMTALPTRNGFAHPSTTRAAVARLAEHKHHILPQPSHQCQHGNGAQSIAQRTHRRPGSAFHARSQGLGRRWPRGGGRRCGGRPRRDAWHHKVHRQRPREERRVCRGGAQQRICCSGQE